MTTREGRHDSCARMLHNKRAHTQLRKTNQTTLCPPPPPPPQKGTTPTRTCSWAGVPLPITRTHGYYLQGKKAHRHLLLALKHLDPHCPLSIYCLPLSTLHTASWELSSATSTAVLPSRFFNSTLAFLGGARRTMCVACRPNTRQCKQYTTLSRLGSFPQQTNTHIHIHHASIHSHHSNNAIKPQRNQTPTRTRRAAAARTQPAHTQLHSAARYSYYHPVHPHLPQIPAAP